MLFEIFFAFSIPPRQSDERDSISLRLEFKHLAFAGSAGTKRERGLRDAEVPGERLPDSVIGLPLDG